MNMRAICNCVGFAGLLSITLLLGACNKSEPEPSAVGVSPPTELRVGVIPVAECAILLDEEVFRRHGITFKFHTAASGTQISDGVIGGGLDFGFSNLVTPIIAESRNIPLRIIGPISLEDDKRARHGLVTRSDRPIGTPSDLRGKVVALNSLQNIDHLLLLRWLEENGVDPSDVRLQTMPFPNMIAALDGGGVDAVALVEPFITIARSKSNRYKTIGNYFSSKSGKATAVSGFVAREEWLKKNPGLAKSLIAALAEAVARASKDEKAFRAHVVTMTKADPAVVEQMPLPWYVSSDYAANVGELVAIAKSKKFIAQNVVPKSLIYDGSKR